MKKSILVLLVVMVLVSCSSDKQEKNIYWVSGFKTNCDGEAGKSECLQISKGENLENAEWQNFYADIQGFQFEEGVLKKIEVMETKREEPVPADASSTIYKMTKELDQKPDSRITLQGDWEVETLLNESLSQDTIVPTLSINLPEMRVNGSGGCNLYNGAISEVGLGTMAFGEVFNTLKMCEHQALEDKFLKALEQTTRYKIDRNKLSLFNSNNEALLVFKRMDKTKNTIRLNDIWTAVRIGGFPINRMVKVPRLEINTNEMKIFGNDGCNNYFGSVTKLTESEISLGALGSTKKLCPEMEIPGRYNAALSKIDTYSFNERLLIFNDEKSNEVLAFIKGD